MDIGVSLAFRVLRAFNETRANLSLSQIAEETGLDMSASRASPTPCKSSAI
ncbi:helix-turn-helix domain-containing protein [Ensifer sp. P24N7]|uniref:helix-turn-helix domain-containing protein n=1 Tax=Sinorhizobium TaxID=28105 RepID=UPI0035F23054